MSDNKKKKVGIITFHFANNFGGALQAYALRQAVDEQCNAEAEIIDYRNWFICLTDTIRLLPVTANLREIISGFRTMRQRLDRRDKFIRFTKRSNKMTGKYASCRQLNQNPPGDDKYICGSDQIWNPGLTFGVASAYYLQFEKDPGNRIAYAPSFGVGNINNRYRRDSSEYINSIGYLSVREESGRKLIKQMTGRDAARLIDPAFLLKKEQWALVGVNPLKNREPYILLYIMQRDMEIYEYARRIKQEKGMRLVEISRYGYNPGFVDETLVSVGPDEFLGLFRDAAFVCTNSYHGLAYSVIFEKEFCLIPCKRFTARITDMIELLQIDNKTGDGGLKSITSRYDREFVKKVIETERETAFSYLKDSLGTGND